MSVQKRERDVESYLAKKLSDLGLGFYKIIPTNRVGMPDRLVPLPDSRCLWVELKTDNGKLSVVQRLRHKELHSQGQEVVVVRSKEEADQLADQLSIYCRRKDVVPAGGPV